ncbi:hypothetical protein ACFX1X_042643 [Malus domestica]
MGTTAIWAQIELMDKGFFLYQKNWLTKESKMHEDKPRTHILNVSTGMVGSSVFGTVKSTCLMEQSLTSSSSAAEASTFAASISAMNTACCRS